MANLMNFQNNRQPSYLDTIGQKAKQLGEFGIAMKQIYDVGKMAYRGFEIAAPFLERAMLAGL